MLKLVIKPNQYSDSVSLMLLSKKLTDLDGVDQVSVMMGSPANREILAATGFDGPELEQAGPGDLVVGVIAQTDEAVDQVLDRIDDELNAQNATRRSDRVQGVRSLGRALTKSPDAELALVSIPGDHVASQVDALLDANLDVMIFSDNVAIDDEVRLKTKARDRGLMVMGPDCGTSSLAGIPLAFANSTRSGSIGIVGASGTGTQEVMIQIDRLGGGVSHAIGLGGRDLSSEVGGITCLQAMAALDADPNTDTIVIVTKPPAAEVRARVEEAAGELSKPVVALFLGERPLQDRSGNIHFAWTLDEAAAKAVELAGSAGYAPADGQRNLVGLYTGGTLASEAAMLIRDSFDLPALDPHHPNGMILDHDGFQIIDLGDDVYTRGRPHPMIDPSSRTDHMPQVFDDPATAVVLLDLVLGYGATDDPAGAVAAPIREGRERARAAGRTIEVVASICGTDRDSQNLQQQQDILTEAGVTVLASNAAAVRHAISLIESARSAGDAAARTSVVPTRIADLLDGPPKIINVGLRSFATDLADAGAAVTQYDWSPIAGGDPQLARLVSLLANR
ncbi:MAG TPA: acyl-CoA synthetase FdrA [Microlunatus sp.]